MFVMSAPTGPMDPERLESMFGHLRADSDPTEACEYSAAEVSELLAAHDHHALMVDRLVRQEYGAVSVACDATGVSADAVRATAASRAADTLRRDPLALAAVDREAEIKRLEDRNAALKTARDSRLEPLRKALVTLAQHIRGGNMDPVAWVLAAEVIEADARGTL